MEIKKDYILLIIVFVLGIFYYNVTLNYPIIFGDEGYYAFHAEMLSKSLVFPKFEYLGTRILHRPFSKPPLFILIDAFAWLIAGEYGIKLMLPLFSILASIMVYIFMKNFYDKNAGLIAAFIFLLTPTLITHGVLNYVDAFLGLMFICGMFFGYRGLKENKRNDLILAGIFSALTVLTKVSGPILFLLFLFYVIFSKNKNWKGLFIIFLITVIITLPWFARNIIFFDNICYSGYSIFRCQDFFTDIEIPRLEGLSFVSGLPQSGTNLDVFKLGILNFSAFTFGLAVTILLIFGIVNNLLKRDDREVFTLISVFVFIFIFFLGGGYRAEDTARYLVPSAIGIAMICSYFTEDLFNELKRYNKIIGAIFVLVILTFVFYFGWEKLSMMPQVKQFSQPFFEACDWVKKNTTSDALIFSVYSHQATYKCERISTATVPDKAEIQLTNNDTAYEHLKLHGFNYVFIQGFTISQENYEDTISIDFLKYLDNSTNFEKVFDSTNVYGNNGMIIYKVL